MADDGTVRRGLYFEEFSAGQTFLTVARTITEADVVNFAGLSGDYNAIHTDAVYAAQGTFGQRVAHGLLVLSIASGLAVRSGILERTVMLWRDISDWKFSRPVVIGDTVHATLEIEDTKALPRMGGGSLTIKIQVINQDEDVVMSGHWTMMVQSRPDA
jgi:3-hydroxybutyryl-CoA dehydratase